MISKLFCNFFLLERSINVAKIFFGIFCDFPPDVATLDPWLYASNKKMYQVNQGKDAKVKHLTENYRPGHTERVRICGAATRLVCTGKFLCCGHTRCIFHPVLWNSKNAVQHRDALGVARP